MKVFREEWGIERPVWESFTFSPRGAKIEVATSF